MLPRTPLLPDMHGVFMRVSYRFFKAGSFTTWDAMFAEVAEFASRIEREDLISLSQSEDQGLAMVTVWYWEHCA